jgi:MarR family transcriptional regulator, organic hydroperoxide resistance regulator
VVASSQKIHWAGGRSLDEQKNRDGLQSGNEIHQDERLARLIRLAARSFNRSLQLRLTTEGVTFGQWIFLRILWDHDGLSQRELSEKAHLTEPTTHTALIRMEELGFIERRRVGPNKRRQHAFMTEKGRALRERLEPLAIETNDLAVDGLTEDEVALLRRALSTVIRNLERDEERAAAAGQRVPATRTQG